MTQFRFEDEGLNSDGARSVALASSGLQKNKNVESPQKRKKELKSEMCEFKDNSPKIEPNKVEINLNLITLSEAQTIAVKKKNGKYTTEHWTAKHKRHKKQKNAVYWAYLEVRSFIRYPCTITFIRYAPKTLDKHDNLPMSMKWICDALCAEITGEHRPGLADNFEGLTIKYDQVKSKVYGVKIIIEF
jgi:hypothetical protein